MEGYDGRHSINSFKKSRKSCVKKKEKQKFHSQFNMLLMNSLKCQELSCFKLSQRNYVTIEYLTDRVNNWLDTLVVQFFKAGLHKLVPWHEKYLNLGGDYMEKSNAIIYVRFIYNKMFFFSFLFFFFGHLLADQSKNESESALPHEGGDNGNEGNK